MPALAIVPFPNSSTTAQQDSGLLVSLSTTMIQLAQANSESGGTFGLACLTQPPEIPDAAIAALHRLMQLLQQLRSPEQQATGASPLTLEELVPYGMEEALDVLDALQTATASKFNSACPPSLIRLDSLVPPILWAIACSTYPLMELLEGMSACANVPDHPCIPGMLRLIPLLEISISHQTWRFDLTTGQEPQNLLDPNLQIQLEKALFPDFFTDRETDPASRYSANQQLQDLLHYLSACHPTLEALFQGVSVDFLFPKSFWLSGELKLNLDFEFVAQENGDVPGPQPSPLEPTALIRLVEPLLLDHVTQNAQRQVLATAIVHIHQQIQPASAVDPVLTIIRTADVLERVVTQTAQQNFSLLQPEQLMDELVPKLFWYLSRSSYAIMRWIGGISVELLQPDRTWETGTLRLMAVLALATDDRTGYIDLATERFIPEHSWQFNSDAVVMAADGVATDDVLVSGSLQQFSPIKLGTLLEQLLRLIPAGASDIALLQEAIAVEWLTPEQEWQSGQLALHWGFAWMPDVG